MSVDYSPRRCNLQHLKVNKGAPTVYGTMDLSFIEMEIMTKERIADGY